MERIFGPKASGIVLLAWVFSIAYFALINVLINNFSVSFDNTIGWLLSWLQYIPAFIALFALIYLPFSFWWQIRHGLVANPRLSAIGGLLFLLIAISLIALIPPVDSRTTYRSENDRLFLKLSEDTTMNTKISVFGLCDLTPLPAFKGIGEMSWIELNLLLRDEIGYIPFVVDQTLRGVLFDIPDVFGWQCGELTNNPRNSNVSAAVLFYRFAVSLFFWAYVTAFLFGHSQKGRATN